MEVVCKHFSLQFSAIFSSTPPFSQSIKLSVLAGDVGLVGAVEGGVSGPEAIGMVESRYHEVAHECGATRTIAQACQTVVRQR